MFYCLLFVGCCCAVVIVSVCFDGYSSEFFGTKNFSRNRIADRDCLLPIIILSYNILTILYFDSIQSKGSFGSAISFAATDELLNAIKKGDLDGATMNS